VAIALWGNMGPAIVRVIEGSQPLHVNMRAGSVMALLGTATGRAFAAVLPARVVKEMLAGPQGDARRADRTPVKDVARELEAIAADYRRHGVTRAVGRPIPGVNAFSAPAFDHEGRPALVLTALGPEDNFPVGWESRPPAAGARGRRRGVAPARPPRLKTPQKDKPLPTGGGRGGRLTPPGGAPEGKSPGLLARRDCAIGCAC
jgi:DNA-binding IclR family transcriptional regulator